MVLQWRFNGASMVLGWTGTAMLEAAKGFPAAESLASTFLHSEPRW